MIKLCHYFVEGECEKILVSTLKDNKNSYIVPGRVSIFNVQQEHFSHLQLRPINTQTTIVLIFDTDVENVNILEENLKILNDLGYKDVVLVMQDKNLEDELVKATDIKNIKQLLPCLTIKEFKSKFISEKRIMEKLINHNFDIGKLWTSKINGKYSKYNNEGNRIKRFNTK